MTGPRPYRAVLFDLLTALLDSWQIWNAVAGDPQVGLRWRNRYLRLTYGQGDYRPYEDLVAEAAAAEGLDSVLAERLSARWDELQPWDDAPGVLRELVSAGVAIGVVTNCSDHLGRRAADRLGTPFDVIVTAETAGAYKPRREPYAQALEHLALPASGVLFVAGSRYDIAGAGQLGMPVWWHNRIGMARGDSPAPIAEHDTLGPLVADVLGPTPPRGR